MIKTAFWLVFSAAFAQAQGAKPCADLSGFKLQGFDVQITKAEVVPAKGNLRSYCRADGVMEPRTGADGKSYAIGFAMALPEEWNSGFVFQGGGGLNGSVREPLGAQAAGSSPALARGYAVVSTDTGHKGTGAFDGSFFQDQEAALNFLYAAVGKVAVVAKQIIAAHYGRGPARSYFIGCSTGGREAMLMAQRYPEYFDGIVSGDPAMRTGYSNLAGRWVAVTLNQIAPGKAFSPAEKSLIVDKILEACDAKDGVKDGMIFNTRGCDFDPAALVCKGARNDTCLTAQQAAALTKAFAGPKDSRGNQVYPGFPFDTGITATQGIPGLLTSGPSPLGPANLSTQQDVGKEAASVAAEPRTGIGDTSGWTNLNAFSGHGGKLIFYHGVSDPWFSVLDTIGYYERMGSANGGVDRVRDWSRLFVVPGMGHCSSGTATLDSFDMLTALANWVEKGTAPDSVMATGRAFPGRSRPLCAYPQFARYTGQGDPDDGKNFVCASGLQP